MKIEMMNSHVRLRRIFLNQSSCDTKALQMIMIQAAHQHWAEDAVPEVVLLEGAPRVPGDEVLDP